MTAADEHDWDDFAVYPFRRQVVDEQTQLFEAPLLLAPPPAPAVEPLAERRPPRRRPSPLKVAVPFALVAFLGALAGAATISDARGVQEVLQAPLAPPVAQAAPAHAPARRAIRRPRPRFVPDVVGLERTAAVRRVKAQKLKVRVRLAVGKPGRVLEQKPRAATKAALGRTVLLVVGKPKPKPRPKPVVPTPTVIVAGVVGLPRDRAADALVEEGLGVRIFGVPSSRPAGTVVAQSPRGGARAESGSYVRINVAVPVRR